MSSLAAIETAFAGSVPASPPSYDLSHRTAEVSLKMATLGGLTTSA